MYVALGRVPGREAGAGRLATPDPNLKAQYGLLLGLGLRLGGFAVGL